MDIAIRNAWVADLRSGHFVQTQGNLKDGKGFCCLGVLASRYADSWVGPEDDRMVPVRNNVCLAEGGLDQQNRSGKLSSQFLAEMELSPMQAATLMSANDCHCSFSQVADIIEHPAFQTKRGIEWLYRSGAWTAKRGTLSLYDENGVRKTTPLTDEDRQLLKDLEN
jgi:hypothetical protein